MSEQSGQNEGLARRRRTRLVAGVLLAVGAGVLIWLLWANGLLQYSSVEQRLAAIDAARAIPDEQNAFRFYDRLLHKYGPTYPPQGVVNDATDTTTKQPWLTKDNPQLAVWVNGQQPLISGLLEACRIEQCRFLVTGSPQQVAWRHDPLSPMRRWTFLLVRAANNDIAEGRTDAGLEKYLALVRMAGHLYQQPMMSYKLVGFAIEALVLGRIQEFIVEGPCTQVHLKAIEAALLPVKNEWDSCLPDMLELERLYRRIDHNWLKRLRYLWKDIGSTPAITRMHEQYLRLLTERAGTRILGALRLYKDKMGRWPDGLEQIRPMLPPEILVDPQNAGPFVYRLSDDGFRLYSRGPNNIDEDPIGHPERKSDDWSIWPPYGITSRTQKGR